MGRIYETAIRIAAKLAPAFKPTTLSAAKAIESLGAESKKLKAIDKDAKVFARLAEEVEAAKARVDAARGALDALSKSESSTGERSKNLTKQMTAAAKAVEAAEKKLAAVETKAAGAGAALAKAGVDTKNLTAEQARLAAALARTEARMSIAAQAAKVGASAKVAGERLQSLGADAAKIATAAGAAGAAMFALAKHTIEVGDEIGDTSTNLGLSTTALQELRFAADRGGSSAEDFDKGFAKLNETVGDALNGNKAARQSFAAMGISMRALRAASPEQRFNLLADAIGKIQDPARRAAAAQNFLGKTSKSMVGFLSEGSAGVAKLRAQALGVMSPEALDNASKAQDALQSASAAIRGVGNTLGAALLPVATKVFTRLTTWITDNRDKIRQWAQTAAVWIETKAIPALERLGPKLFDVAGKALALLEKVSGAAGGFENLGLAMGALRLAPLGASLISITKDLVLLTAKMVAYASATWGASAAQTALSAAQAGGGAMVPGALSAGSKALGLLGSAGGVLAAGAAGYAVGTFLDQTLGISDKLTAGVGAQGSDVGGGAIPVWTSPQAPSGGTSQKVDIGKIEVVVPPGMSSEEAQAFTQRAVVEAMKQHAAEQRRLSYR